jgi:hypothetical protein
LYISVDWAYDSSGPPPGNRQPFNGQSIRHDMVANGNFYHIAFGRYQGVMRFHVDGKLMRTDVYPSGEGVAKDTYPYIGYLGNPYNYPTNPAMGLAIGGPWNGASSSLRGNLFFGVCAQGMIDAVRVSKAAWYQTDNFTPPNKYFEPNISPKHFNDVETIYTDIGMDPMTIRPPLPNVDYHLGHNTVTDEVIFSAEINGPQEPPQFYVDSSGYQNINDRDTTGTSTSINGRYINFHDGTAYGRVAILALYLHTGSQTFTLGASPANHWTLGGQFSDSVQSVCWAYHILNATDDPVTVFPALGNPYPPISWTTGSKWALALTQVKGQNSITPIGATASASGQGTTASMSGLTTSHGSASLVLGFCFGYNTSGGFFTQLTTPSGYDGIKSDIFSPASLIFAQPAVGPAGATSAAVSFHEATNANMDWASLLIEINDIG